MTDEQSRRWNARFDAMVVLIWLVVMWWLSR